MFYDSAIDAQSTNQVFPNVMISRIARNDLMRLKIPKLLYSYNTIAK